MTPVKWPASSFFPLSYFPSIFQEQTVTRATALYQLENEPIARWMGNPFKERRRGQGLQRREAEKDVVVVSFLCHQLSLSLKRWDQSENVCAMISVEQNLIPVPSSHQESFERNFPGILLQKLEQYENCQFTFMHSHLPLETPDNC